jgi:4-carboxymuconolactone decarboxylase
LTTAGRKTGPVLRAYDAAMATTAPRLPPLAPGEWDDVLTRVLENSPGGTDEPMHIFTTLGRADPELFRRWLGFGGALLAGSLPGRLRELVILRSAARFGGRYEWAQHVGLAGVQGVTPAELVAVSNGEGALDAVDWPPLERAALRAVDETADEGAVSDSTWETLAEDLQESELIELLMLIGHYMMLTTVLGSLRIQLEPRAEALAESVPGGPAA